MTSDRVERWLTSLLARHTAPFTSAEFLKAVRALSARYVEQRSTLHASSPLDSAGKRAAFAAFYAPLHVLTVMAVVARSRLADIALTRMVDLGCGTGAAAAGWALCLPAAPSIVGVDQYAWTLSEARVTYRELDLRAVVRREDLMDTLASLLSRERDLSDVGIVLGWSVNELPVAKRDRLLPQLITASGRGAHIMVIEPIATRATPWWPEWRDATSNAGWRADEWTFSADLPAALAKLDEAAGFRRTTLTARTLMTT